MKQDNCEIFYDIVCDYLDGVATADEIALVEGYYDHFENHPDGLSHLTEEEIEEKGRQLKKGIDERIAEAEAEEKKRSSDQMVAVPLYRRLGWSIAAALALMFSSVFYFNGPFLVKRFFSPEVAARQDIAPGGNKAVLTLSNGSKIALGDVKTGTIASQQGTAIKLSQGGQLVYSAAPAAEGALMYNTIETRNGGQYRVILPDGTRVWINAASSLRYPVNFVGNERRVELMGEAYFEVAKQKSKTFKVVTANQEVTVLGTHFNINAYPNEGFSKTTLLEGSVRVNRLGAKHSVLIKPGQEASVSANGSATAIEVKAVDPDAAISWKNGYFMFDDESLESILQKVSRWYDVDIVHMDAKSKQLRFSGTISRYSQVSQVLRKLALTESVHFQIDGRKIIVNP